MFPQTSFFFLKTGVFSGVRRVCQRQKPIRSLPRPHPHRAGCSVCSDVWKHQRPVCLKGHFCGLVSGCTGPADVMVTSSALQKAVAIVPLVTFRFSSRRRKTRHQRPMRHLATRPSVPSSRTSRQRLRARTKLSTDAPFAVLLAASRCFETSE